MTFDVGSRVVYPVHGIADVVGREDRTIEGRSCTYLVLRVASGERSEHLTLRVPEDRLDEVGVRDAVSVEDALAVLEVLAVRDPRVASNWSRRFKNHQEKLRSGDLFAQAEVVRNLALRREHARLGPAESTMLRQARQGVVAELAVSFGISDDDAADRVDAAIGRGHGTAPSEGEWSAPPTAAD